jgi:glycosyltransferase involved in cell wall biosynthesis
MRGVTIPTKIITLELGQPLPEAIAQAEAYDRVWLIMRRYGVPVGRVTIENGRTPILRDQLRGEIVRQLSRSLIGQTDHAQADEFANVTGLLPNVPAAFAAEPDLVDLLPELKPEIGQRFFLSIVVCTRDRPDDLRSCLSSLTRLEPGRHRLELIVVDNNPASGLTEPVVRSFPGVRYETEPRPGVPYARNKGLAAAHGEIVAYIDDDVLAPPDWPVRILAPFTDERVMCVSGLVLPFELETRSQELFETYGGLGRGFQPRIYDEGFFNRSRRYVVPTWDLGATANAAIRKSVIQQVGRFDETLGPGLPTGVGEDIYMFYRILKFGHICYYEPAAYVWHKHRRDMTSLQHQLYDYNKGVVSYHLRTLLSDGDRRALWQLLWDLPKWHWQRVTRILRGRYDYPLRLIWTEVKGNVAGPYAFYRAVKMRRRINDMGGNPVETRFV